MCGIAGIKTNHKHKEIFLRKMMSCMGHRGPDSRGEYLHEDLALGHLRLKVIDLTSLGDQPMSNENQNIWLISNAEIYNFKQLRQELESKGHRFRSSSDNEVIIHSYEEWGISCLDRLRGMFAFCLWDKNQKRLFLVRDRLGIKPVYYYFKDGVFIFASEVRAILASSLVSRNLSIQGLESYLDYGGLKEPLTMVADIHSLMPAHYIILDDAQFEVVRYWNPLDARTPGAYLKIDEITERMGSLLEESIRLALISDAPLGVFLSGGIDSSSIVNMAAQLSAKIKTVSVVFGEEKFDESRYSRLIAKRYNTQHSEFFITDEHLLKNFDSCLQAMDEPTFNGINTYFISKIAKECGLTVVLSGLGGDELFCGYPTFGRVAKLARFCLLWRWLPRSFRRLSSAMFSSLSADTTANRKIADFLNTGCSEHPYFWTRLLFTAGEKQRLFKRSQKSVKAMKGSAQLKDLDIINQVSYLEMNNYMVDILLRDTDFMSMAHSLEVRVPLIDHKLIEFILSIPGRFKRDNQMPKPLLVKSLKRPLPEEIYKRPKMGFVFPFDYWLRDKLKQEVEDTLLTKDNMSGELLDNSAVLSIWRGFLSKRISWQRPWAIYVLKRWMRSYLG